MATTALIRALAAACAAALAAVPAAQDPPTPAPNPPPARERPAHERPAHERPVQLEEWPKLGDTDKQRVQALVGQFRKADPKLHEAARTQLVAIGEAAVPLLFQQVTDQPNDVNAHLFAVFDVVCKPQHAALLARESKKNKVELRRYLTGRLCRFVDKEMLPVLQTAQRDADEETAFYGALGALALGRRDALPAVLDYCKTHWTETVAVVAEVLPAARSNEAGSWVFEAIAKAGVPERMTGLRLARYLAVKDHALILRGYLQSPDAAVKREAINALRVLHGEPPIENLPVFQAIEMAKEWLKKV